jgi:AraC family transcriptional regulator
MDAALYEMVNQGVDLELFLDSAQQELAGALVDRHAVRRRSTSMYRGGLTPARLRRVLDLVRAKIKDEVTLDELAESVGLSTTHFSQPFLKSTWKSPHQFVLHGDHVFHLLDVGIEQRRDSSMWAGAFSSKNRCISGHRGGF